MKPSAEWLSSEAAAAHLGFGENLNAFNQWVKRARKKDAKTNPQPLKVYKLGRLLRFKRADLDRRIEAR